MLPFDSDGFVITPVGSQPPNWAHYAYVSNRVAGLQQATKKLQNI